MRVPLRQVCVAAMMGVLSLFVAPAPAHAWWDFIEEFSRPRKFQGPDIQLRLFCVMQRTTQPSVVPRPPARPFRRRSPQREGQRFGHPALLECSSVSAPSEPTVKKPKWPLIWACASCGATMQNDPTPDFLRDGPFISIPWSPLS